MSTEEGLRESERLFKQLFVIADSEADNESNR